MTTLVSDATISSAVERASAGDEAAFAQIVATYHADLIRVAYGICGDRDVAADAAQASWTIAWRKLRTLRDPGRIRPWLVAVVANEARHLVRRQRGVILVDVEQAGDAVADPGVDIGRVDLVNALAHLKPDERSLLAMRYGAGLDSSEIAAQVGMSPSGVRARLGRILGRLRKELDDD